MKQFTTHKGTVAILYRGNIDTDQIIPKQHLKSIKKTGFDEGLFSDWRFLEDGSDNPDFELNQPQYIDATILLVGNNFGCGSSREHAVWAILQSGYHAIIAPFKEKDSGRIHAFADIFKNNSVKNGLLLIELPEKDVLELKEAVEKEPHLEMDIDLEKQTVILGNLTKSFNIDSAAKERLLKGFDDIGISLQYEDEIGAFEKNHDVQLVL